MEDGLNRFSTALERDYFMSSMISTWFPGVLMGLIFQQHQKLLSLVPSTRSRRRAQNLTVTAAIYTRMYTCNVLLIITKISTPLHGQEPLRAAGIQGRQLIVFSRFQGRGIHCV